MPVRIRKSKKQVNIQPRVEDILLHTTVKLRIFVFFFWGGGGVVALYIYQDNHTHTHIYTHTLLLYIHNFLFDKLYIHTPKKKNLVFLIKIMFDGDIS